MPISQLRFINYPSPKESRTNRKREPASGNPVLSGWLLVVLAKLLHASAFVQRLLWRLNKFDKVKDLPELEGYAPRYDPTVIPVTQGDDEPLPLTELPKPRQRKSEASYYTTADYHEAYISGALTPSDVVEFLLPLITRRGNSVGKYAVAYLDVQSELVRAAARASTERYRAGKPLSTLDGVPIAVKDEVNLKGHKKSLGSKLDFKDEQDATDWCVWKWEEAGGIIIGKTNMHELGLDTTNNNPIWGTPLNPHNEDYYTGGSSGGSGCTAAQGICPIVLGVDGGGSIRIPSSWCGLYGLKTSHNRVSIYPGDVGANSVAVCGPMSPNIDDLALAYRIMAQPCPEDPINAMFPQTTSRQALTNHTPTLHENEKRYIGIPHDWVALSDPEIQTTFRAAINHYTTVLNYTPIPITIPLQSENEKAFSLTILAEAMTILTPSKINSLIHPNQILLDVSGTHATAQDLIASNRLRERAMRHMAWLWRQYPGMLVLTPTTPIAGWKIGKKSDVTDGFGASDADMSLRSMEYSCFGNWIGTPAITCPMGYDRVSGVPVGIMALGEWGAEEQLISFAREHEAFLGEGGVRRPMGPGNWVDVLGEARKR